MKDGHHAFGVPILALVLLFALTLAGCQNGDMAKAPPRSPILQSPTEILRPYVWFYSDFDNSDAGFEKQLDYGDPFRVTTLLIQDWTANHDRNRIERRIASVVSKWNLDQEGGRLSYTFDYGKLKAGWYSGMDSWSFPMLLVGLWQETGNLNYRRLAEGLIAAAARDVTSGGTVWRSERGCWFSEYAWDGMSQDDEFHVLNGHLYALQAVRMLATALDAPALAALYRCGVEGTKARSAEFLPSGGWPFYMLNPQTIDQTHYVIYETMQFDALHALDPDPFFKEQASARREVLRRHFPVYARVVTGVNRIAISAVGAPHPYSIDTYALELECSDGNTTEHHSLPNPTDVKRPVVERAMLDVVTHLDSATTRCRVTAEYVGHRLVLYEAPVRVLPDPVAPGVEITVRHEALFDAWSPDGQRIVIDPERRHGEPGMPETYLDTQGRLVLTPVAPIPFGRDDLLGFEFEADGPLRLGVTLQSKAHDYFRYYPATPAGERVLVLLSPLGFDGGAQIESIERLVFFFYTDQQKQPVVLTPTRVSVFRNGVELREYFRLRDPSFYTE